MILPDTAHPAFLKGAHLFCLELVIVPTDPVTTLVDPADVRAAITDRTAVIVGSAGNYAYGTIDPIAELSEIAVEHGVGLHVDGCLGGWILPWGQRLGYDIPVFDFRLPGVTSISADTHKYGYGPKGLSVLLWRDPSYRRHHYYVEPEWNGGLYASAALLGSRSGGAVAGTWAALRRLGEPGYRRKAKAVFETAFAMQDAVKSHPELIDHGRPDVLLRLPVRRVRHLPRQRPHEAQRLALQRPAATARPAHVRDRPADPTRCGRGIRHRSRRGRRICRTTCRRDAAQRIHVRGAGANMTADDRQQAIEMISGFMDMVTDGPPG